MAGINPCSSARCRPILAVARRPAPRWACPCRWPCSRSGPDLAWPHRPAGPPSAAGRRAPARAHPCPARRGNRGWSVARVDQLAQPLQHLPVLGIGRIGYGLAQLVGQLLAHQREHGRGGKDGGARWRGGQPSKGPGPPADRGQLRSEPRGASGRSVREGCGPGAHLRPRRAPNEADGVPRQEECRLPGHVAV